MPSSFAAVLGSEAHLSAEIEPTGRIRFTFDDTDGFCYGLNAAYHSPEGYQVDAKSLMDASFAVRGTVRLAHENGGTWESGR